MSGFPEVLRDLLAAAGPSGFETRAAEAFRHACEPLAEVTTDAIGSVVARLPGTGDGPSVAVYGHLDEIGLIVTHIDDDGLLWAAGLGGWDPIVLVGQRVEVVTRTGTVPGVVARKPIHLMEEDDRKRVPKLKDLHIDLGAASGDEARELVAVGDAVVITAQPPLELANGRFAAKAMDNRIGCYVAYETLRLLHDGGGAPGDFYAVGATHEEMNSLGAATTTYALQPDVAIVVDVTHETQVPGVDERTEGRHRFGSGPAIMRAATLSPRVFDMLVEAAEAEGIDYTVEATGRHTGTDADTVMRARSGTPTGGLGVPLRYMHSPVELVQLDDIAATARLCAAFARRYER